MKPIFAFAGGAVLAATGFGLFLLGRKTAEPPAPVAQVVQPVAATATPPPTPEPAPEPTPAPPPPPPPTPAPKPKRVAKPAVWHKFTPSADASTPAAIDPPAAV